MGLIKTNIGTMSKGYFGSSPIKKIYFGSTQVFSASTPYYTEGTQNVDWIKGRTAGDVTFNPSYMEVTTLQNTVTVDASAVTDSTVDLTNINTIYVDLSTISGNSPKSPAVYICISTIKGGTYSQRDARTTASGVLSRQILSVDVSGLSGSYYIRIHVYKANATYNAYHAVNVYNVWGE